MSKSKSLSTVPSLDVHVVHIRGYHKLAMNSAAQTACAAAMAGLELQKVKVLLKKSATGCTFDQWMEANQERLEFSRKTAYNYIRLAENLKGKLLKREEQSVVALLEKAPSELNDAQTKRLLQAMHKSTDGASLNELYQDFGIVRLPHKAPARKALSGGDDEAIPPQPEAPVEELAQQVFNFFSERSDELRKTYTLGKDKIFLVTKWPTEHLDEAIEKITRDLEMLRQIRKARK